MRKYLSLSAMVLLTVLTCGQDSDKARLESLYRSNQEDLNIDLQQLTADHYLFDTLQRDSGVAQITLELKKKTWRNPNDTRGLVDSVSAAIMRHVPLDSGLYSVTIGTKTTRIAQINVEDTVVAIEYFFDHARDSIKQNDIRRSYMEERSQEQLENALTAMVEYRDSVKEITWYTPRIITKWYFENTDPYLIIGQSGNDTWVNIRFRYRRALPINQVRKIGITTDDIFLEIEVPSQDATAPFKAGNYAEGYETTLTTDLYQIVQALIYSEHSIIRIESEHDYMDIIVPWFVKDALEQVLDASRALGAIVPHYEGHVSPACISRKKVWTKVEKITQLMTDELQSESTADYFCIDDISDVDGDGIYEVAVWQSCSGSMGGWSDGVYQFRDRTLSRISSPNMRGNCRFRGKYAVFTGGKPFPSDANCCPSRWERSLLELSGDTLHFVSSTVHRTKYYGRQYSPITRAWELVEQESRHEEVKPSPTDYNSNSAAASKRLAFAKYGNKEMEGEVVFTVRGDGYKIINYSTPIMTDDYAYLLYMTSKDELIKLGFEWVEYTDGGSVRVAYKLIF